MDELEQRLRSTLTSMAEEVPPSHSAWDEQQRRLALKSRRHRFRPAVMAAVAAAAAVLIAVPIMVIQQATAPVQPGALPEASVAPTPPTTTHSLPGHSVEYRPHPGETLVIPPVTITTEGPFGSDKPMMSYAYVINSPKGFRELCLAQAPQGEPINGPDQAKYGEPSCFPLAPPKAGRYEWGRRQGVTNNTRTFWFYVMSRPAAEMLLKQADGSGYAQATNSGSGDDVVLFVAFTNSPKQPKAFTVFDKQHQTLFNGE